MQPPPSSRRAGFTLIEVMLTLLIMAGIMVTITQILTAARQSRDTIHNIQEKQLAGPAILNRLEADLRAMFTYNRDPRDFVRIQDRVLSGFDADSIDFVTSVDSLIPDKERSSDPFQRADINETGYRLRIHPDSDDFLEIYRREDFGIDDDVFEGGRFSLLHDRVKGFDIQVYDEDGQDAEPVDAWGTEGEDENIGVPNRIEIELTIELAPRLVREQLIIDRRTITYKRIVRFPEALRIAQEILPVPVIPNIEPPVAEPTAGGAAGGDELADPGAADGGDTTITTGIESDRGGDSGGGANPFSDG